MCSATDDSPFRVGAQIIMNDGGLITRSAGTQLSPFGYSSGERFIVTGGPQCIDGQRYWEVAYGWTLGWVSERDEFDAYRAQVAEPISTLGYSADGAPFEALNMTWTHDPALGAALVFDALPSQRTMTGYLPPSRIVLFADAWRQSPPETLQRPRLQVMPAGPYRREDGDDWRYMETALEGALPADYIIQRGEFQLPYLPQAPAAPVYATRIQRLNFQNGRGLRYVTQFAQNIALPDNNSMHYNYQGLTNDGLWYVSLRFPVRFLPFDQNPTLRERITTWDFSPDMPDAYPQEVEALVTLLRDATDADFSPNLGAIDAWVASLQVGPYGDADPDITARCGDDIPPSRLIVGDRAYNRTDAEVRIRDGAGLAGLEIGRLPAYGTGPVTYITILDGPRCVDGYAWWQVDVDGLIGWAAEGASTPDGDAYWLQPLYDSLP